MTNILCKACFSPCLCVFHLIWVSGGVPKGLGRNLLMWFYSPGSSKMVVPRPSSRCLAKGNIILLKLRARRRCPHLRATSEFFPALGVGDPRECRNQIFFLVKVRLGTRSPPFVAWAVELVLGTLNPCFIAWPLELGLGTLNPRFVAWPLELGTGTCNPRS